MRSRNAWSSGDRRRVRLRNASETSANGKSKHLRDSRIDRPSLRDSCPTCDCSRVRSHRIGHPESAASDQHGRPFSTAPESIQTGWWPLWDRPIANPLWVKREFRWASERGRSTGRWSGRSVGSGPGVTLPKSRLQGWKTGGAGLSVAPVCPPGPVQLELLRASARS
jgi:hypothetical protein